jgi:uncharacterized SAM-binding protein YcdF (DUF218 family)
MSVYLIKLVTVLVLPLGWVMLLGLLAVLLLWRGRRRAALRLLGVQLGVLWVCAMPWTSHQVGAWLESAYPRVALQDTPEADVAVVLGGAVRVVGDPPSENLTGSSDRVLRAARLWRLHKLRAVLAVGGNQPWRVGGAPEAQLIRDLLVEWGVPFDAILTEPLSQTTRQNAQEAARIIRRQGWRSVLLVTSAAHMPRAVEAFAREGITVIPSATNYQVAGPLPPSLLNFLPDGEALMDTSRAVHELIGRGAQHWAPRRHP